MLQVMFLLLLLFSWCTNSTLQAMMHACNSPYLPLMSIIVSQCLIKSFSAFRVHMCIEHMYGCITLIFFFIALILIYYPIQFTTWNLHYLQINTHQKTLHFPMDIYDIVHVSFYPPKNIHACHPK